MFIASFMQSIYDIYDTLLGVLTVDSFDNDGNDRHKENNTNIDTKWRDTYPYFHIYMLCGNEREEEKVS